MKMAKGTGTSPSAKAPGELTTSAAELIRRMHDVVGLEASADQLTAYREYMRLPIAARREKGLLPVGTKTGCGCPRIVATERDRPVDWTGSRDAVLRSLLNCQLLDVGLKVWHRADCAALEVR
jgi:hypothetical protein